MLHRWVPADPPRAAVHVLHGMSEHAGRYAAFAGRLNAAGLAVWAHDHRGHGPDPTSPGPRGHIADRDGWRHIVDDAWSVSQQLRAAAPGVPLLLFAHSMGSFVGQYLMSEHGEAYDGVILCGTNGPPGWQEGLARALGHLHRRLADGQAPGTWVTNAVFGTYNRTFAPNRTSRDWLSRDEAEVDAAIADTWCGAPLTVQAWLDVLEARRRLGDRDFVGRVPKDLPVRIIAGSRDPVAEYGSGATRLLHLYERAGLSRVSLRIYDGARHELLMETNRREVVDEVIEWIESVIA